MDQKKFDELTRKLTDGASRRGVVRGLLGGATAGIATAVGLSAADAKRKKKKCDAPKSKCGRKCVDTSKSKKHCGDCKTKCKKSETCVDGVCVATS